MLVLDVKGDALDAASKRVISATVTQEIGALDRFTVVSQADVNHLAALEGDKQELGCDTSTCLTEIAGALGARYVIFGDVAKLGGLTVVNLNLFDTETASAVERASFETSNLEEIPELARRTARSLTRSRTGGGTASTSVLPFVIGGAGAAFALAGLTFDALSSTSNNRALDGYDFIGPLALAGGAALVVTGLVLAGDP